MPLTLKENIVIIVTGATGKLGQQIVEQLLERVPAGEVGVSVRAPEKATAFAERGIRVRQGDFSDAASLRHAFEGASQVLIISSNSSGEDAVRHHGNAIEAAKAAGAGRVLYTSHMGSNAASLFSPMRDHAATEAILDACGIAFTSLRNGFYAGSGIMLMGPATETGKISAPGDGPVSWTAHSDLAEAAVIALTDDRSLNGITPPLTALEAIDLEGIAAMASDLTGRTITRDTVTNEQFRESLLSRHLPGPVAEMFVGLFAASRNGEFAAVDPTLERLLGRPPMLMRDVLANSLSIEQKS